MRASSLQYLQAPVKATRGLPCVLEENETADPLVHIEWARRTPVSAVPVVVRLTSFLL